MTSHGSLDIGDMLLLDHVQQTEHSYSGAAISNFIATRSTFDSCDFTYMKIDRACFGASQVRSVYKDCAFDHSEIRASAPGIARFERCTFLSTHFLELNCRNVEFVDCVFSGTIEKGYFNGSVISEDEEASASKKLDFSGNDFHLATLIDVGFRSGVDLTKQCLPTGDQYFNIGNIDSFREVLARMASSATMDVKKGLGILSQMAERDSRRGQKQLFLSSAGFPASFQSSFASLRKALS